MPFGLIIGAGLGIANQMFIQKPKEDRQRTLAAAEARYSPWTGMKPGPVNETSPLGAALSGAGAGASMAQGLQNSQAQSDYLKGGGSPKVSFNSNLNSFGGSGGGFGSPGGMFGQSASPNYLGVGQNPWQSQMGIGNYGGQ